MNLTTAIMISLGICFLSAFLERSAAGKNVKPLFAKLRAPAYAPPTWLWVVIGVLYYVICFFVLFRILVHQGDKAARYFSLTLILVMMAINGIFNYTFFRLESLYHGRMTFKPYLPAVAALFVCLLRLEPVAAFVLIPYFFYLVFAMILIDKFLQLNPDLRGH